MIRLLNPRQLLSMQLESIYFENAGDEFEKFDLIITLDENNLSLRELGAFVMIIDRFYGRLTTVNLNTYAQKEERHLKLTSITSGSTIATINNILGLMSKEEAMFLLLLIKFLSSAIKAGSEGLVKISKAFDKFEKGKLSRYIRKSLKEDIGQDKLLSSLDEKSKHKLAELLEKRYTLEKRHLAYAAKFARKKLKSVELKKRKHD